VFVIGFLLANCVFARIAFGFSARSFLESTRLPSPPYNERDQVVRTAEFSAKGGLRGAGSASENNEGQHQAN
jgi:hypothetical protein